MNNEETNASRKGGVFVTQKKLRAEPADGWVSLSKDSDQALLARNDATGRSP
ncbi:MAG: hypothetical protein KGI50_02560 [Patescibacteria group bacterium]|nr:hypothetical protein [Patescibacteria group bacterium]MDE2437771.1 hypothetical protein [Patescibacteria group bacterium]